MKLLRLPSHTLPSCRSFFYELLLAPFASSLFVPPHLFPTMAAGHLLQLISLEPLHPCSLNQVHFLDPPTPSLLRCTCSNVCHVYHQSKSWPQTTSRISCCHCDRLSAKAHIPHLSDCTIVSPWDTPQMQVNSDPVHLKQPTNLPSFTQLEKHKGAKKKPKRKPGIVAITTWASLKLSFLDKQHRHLGTCVLHILD